MAFLEAAIFICVCLPTGLLFVLSACLVFRDYRELRSKGLFLFQSLLQNSRAQPDDNTEESDPLRQRVRVVKVVKFVTARQARKMRSRTLSRKRQVSLAQTAEDEAEGWLEWMETESFPHFLELPRETRDCIYEHTMDQLPTRCSIAPHQPLSTMVVYPGTLPSVCFANKQLHREGLQAWLRRTRLVLEDSGLSPTLAFDFLTAVEGFREIRMLSFLNMLLYSTSHSRVSLSSLAIACPGLKRLRLEFKGEIFVEVDRSANGRTTFFFPASGAILVRQQLESLFRLGALRQLTICTLRSDYLISTNSRYAVLKREDLVVPLKIAIEDGFKKAGRQGKVEVVYTGDLSETVM